MSRLIVLMLTIVFSTFSVAESSLQTLDDISSTSKKIGYFKYQERHSDFKTVWEGHQGYGLDFWYKSDNTCNPDSIMQFQAFGKKKDYWNAVSLIVAFRDARDKKAELEFKNTAYRLLSGVTDQTQEKNLHNLIYNAHFFEQIKQEKFRKKINFVDDKIYSSLVYDKKPNGSYGYILEITRPLQNSKVAR